MKVKITHRKSDATEEVIEGLNHEAVAKLRANPGELSDEDLVKLAQIMFSREQA